MGIFADYDFRDDPAMLMRRRVGPLTEGGQRASDALEFVHAETCLAAGADHGAADCALVPRPAVVAAALAVLDERGRASFGRARRVFHDQSCMGGEDCPEADAHALRTQARPTQALRRFIAGQSPRPAAGVR